MKNYLSNDSVLERIWNNPDDAVFDNYNSENLCLCCGQRAQFYGSGWITQKADGTQESGDCSREVCVICLESGCWGKDGKGCFGNSLTRPAAESHINCGCRK